MAKGYRGFDSAKEYYLLNREVFYPGMSRSEINMIDPGLIQTLYRKRDIDVIPLRSRGKPKIPEKMGDLICCLYSEFPSQRIVAQIVDLPRITVKQILKRRGVKMNSPGRKRVNGI